MARVLTLGAGPATVTVHLDAGARIGQITVSGRRLLVDVPADAPPDTGWGSFPMAPWAGRIRGGNYRFDGVERRLTINHRDGDDPQQAHAIHGLVFDRSWEIVDASDTSCTCTCPLDWEFAGRAVQRIDLSPDRVELSLTVESDGATFPAEVGWHPWFRKPDGIGFAPRAMYRRDRHGLPTGELVEPAPGPWDDCFVADGPVTVGAPVDALVASDCDHWVVFDEPVHATCVEPQSGPPDAFNLGAHVVTPDRPLRRTMTVAW